MLLSVCLIGGITLITLARSNPFSDGTADLNPVQPVPPAFMNTPGWPTQPGLPPSQPMFPPPYGPTQVVVPAVPSVKWQRITTLPRQINSFAVDPSNPQIVYAATGENGSGSGVYKSEDRGKTWRNASQGLPSEDVAVLAFGRSAPFTLYAIVGVRGDVYASSDNAASWTRIGNTGLFGGFWYRLVALPGSNNALFALAVGMDAGSDTGELFRSKDGAQTWENLLDKRHFTKGQQTPIRQIMIDPNKPATIYLMCDYVGIVISSDGGAAWRSFGRPPEGEAFYEHGAALVLFGDQPVILIGEERSGAWATGPQ